MSECRLTPKDVVGPVTPVLFRMSSFSSKSFSIFRIFFVFILCYDLFLNILPHWEMLYSEHGVIPNALNSHQYFRSILGYGNHPALQNFVITAYIISLISILVGYRTRLFCLFAFICLSSINDRNPVALSNAELLMQCMLLWSCFLPLDRYWSFSSAIRNATLEDRQAPWPIVPLIAVYVQIAIIYVFAGLFKLENADYTSGAALRYVVSSNHYGSAWGQYVFNIMPDSVEFILCWWVILFQIFFPLLIYSPVYRNYFRAVALMMGVCLHGSFIFLMNIDIFPFLSLVCLVLYIPDHWWNYLGSRRVARQSNIKIFYDPDCGFCRSVSLLLREFCLPVSVPVRPSIDDQTAHDLLQRHKSWVVQTPSGEYFLKWRAVAYVLKQSPVFYVLGALTDLSFLRSGMEKFYDVIGQNRSLLGRMTSGIFRALPESVPDRTAQYFCLFLMTILIFITTLGNVVPYPFQSAPIELRKKVNMVAEQFGIFQKWDLFIPPNRDKSIHKITVLNTDGTSMDLDYLTDLKIRKIGDYYWLAGSRMRKAAVALFYGPYNIYRQNFSFYLCHLLKNEGKMPYEINLYFSTARNFDDAAPFEIREIYRCSSL